MNKCRKIFTLTLTYLHFGRKFILAENEGAVVNFRGLWG